MIRWYCCMIAQCGVKFTVHAYENSIWPNNIDLAYHMHVNFEFSVIIILQKQNIHVNPPDPFVWLWQVLIPGVDWTPLPICCRHKLRTMCSLSMLFHSGTSCFKSNTIYYWVPIFNAPSLTCYFAVSFSSTAVKQYWVFPVQSMLDINVCYKIFIPQVRWMCVHLVIDPNQYISCIMVMAMRCGSARCDSLGDIKTMCLSSWYSVPTPISILHLFINQNQSIQLALQVLHVAFSSHCIF